MKINIESHYGKSGNNLEVDIGEPGNFVLIRSRGKDSYVLGRIKGIKTLDKKRNYRAFGTMIGRESEKEVDCLEFMGPSYRLTTTHAFGLDFPALLERNPNARSHRNPETTQTKYLEVRRIEKIVAGLGNIITELETGNDTKYRGHSELIKRISERQERGQSESTVLRRMLKRGE